MRKIMIAATLSLMCGSAFAQSSTGPAPQSDNMNKPGMTNTTTDKGSMEKGTMNNTTGMSKDGMKNDNMTQGGASKDGTGQMNKGGMSK
jgi:pentapeptide MXKDX repeat protein